MNLESISFRHLLVEALSTFLKTIDPGRAYLDDFISELVVCLSQYREEGMTLHPVVFICEDIRCITELLEGHDPLWIGEGQLTHETVKKALKQCSPLGERRQWAIFITIQSDRVRYGVFRTDSSALSPTTFVRLRSMKNENCFLLGLTQIANSIVEVRSATGRGISLHLSGEPHGIGNHADVIQDFIHVVTFETDSKIRNAMRDFYYRVITDMTRSLHGALIVVLPTYQPKMDIFIDGVKLDEPLEISRAILAYEKNPGSAEMSTLYAQASLIRGMMNCDGITIMRSDGAIIGYNFFIQHPILLNRMTQDPEKTNHASQIGGARRRAFEALAVYVGSGINSVVYRSQDGLMENASIPYLSASHE